MKDDFGNNSSRRLKHLRVLLLRANQQLPTEKSPAQSQMKSPIFPNERDNVPNNKQSKKQRDTLSRTMKLE